MSYSISKTREELTALKNAPFGSNPEQYLWQLVDTANEANELLAECRPLINDMLWRLIKEHPRLSTDSEGEAMIGRSDLIKADIMRLKTLLERIGE